MLERSRTQFETTAQPFLVKGKERAITAYSVGSATGVVEEEAAQQLPIVGRERELEELRAAVDAARMRRGQVAELVGEPGIGKSRLVEELKTLAVGFTQLVTRCDQYAVSVPYFPFRSLLRPLAGITEAESAAEAGARLTPWVEAVMPELAPWLPLLAIPFDAEVAPTPESEAIETAFRRERSSRRSSSSFMRVLLMPTLIVFEDAHWMDDSSPGSLLISRAAPRRGPGSSASRAGHRAGIVDEPGDGRQLDRAPAAASKEAAELALAAAEDVALPARPVVGGRSGRVANPLFVREFVSPPAMARRTRCRRRSRH